MFEEAGRLASAHREEKHNGCNEDSTEAWMLRGESAVMLANGEREEQRQQTVRKAGLSSALWTWPC